MDNIGVRIYRNDPELNRILQYSDDSGRYPGYHKVMESDENGKNKKKKSLFKIILEEQSILAVNLRKYC